jgi:ketosteroid isomerase-like protein
MSMTPSETVRLAYERFNNKDFEGVLDLFHPDAEHADVLREGVTHRGRDAILCLWTERFAEASAPARIYEMFDVASGVVAVVRYAAIGRDGALCGSPMIAVHRSVFREDRIARLEVTVVSALSDEAKALFLQPA